MNLASIIFLNPHDIAICLHVPVMYVCQVLFQIIISPSLPEYLHRQKLHVLFIVAAACWSVCSIIRHNFERKPPRTTSEAGTAYPSGAPEFTPGFQWGSCNSIFSFICMFCRSLFVLFYFFFWPLCCLFFFDIRFLITPLMSSNSSNTSFVLYLAKYFRESDLQIHFCQNIT